MVIGFQKKDFLRQKRRHTFLDVSGDNVIIEKAKLKKELAWLQRLQKKSKEQDKEIEELKKKISELKES